MKHLYKLLIGALFILNIGLPQNTNSLFFDGVNDYVDISVSTADDFTVLCWIKFETANNSNAILSSSGSDFIRIDAANGNQI